MATQAPKYPAALVAASDIYGDTSAAGPLTLNGAHTSSVTTITTNESVPASWPTAGVVLIDTELVSYTGKGATSLTGCTRGVQTSFGGGAAASHNSAANVYLVLSPQMYAQIAADVVAVEAQLGKQFMTRQAAITAAASTTVDFASGDWAPVSMGASITTLTLSNPVTGHVYLLELIQDATGGRTVTWPASVKWPGGTAPTLSGASKTDLVTLVWNGTNYLATSLTNY